MVVVKLYAVGVSDAGEIADDDGYGASWGDAGLETHRDWC